jgi:hypothetical protein
MNLDKIYYDSYDQPLNILQVVKREPEWAANMIQAGEKAIEALAEKEAELALNAKMLARQTDLAREAEIELAELRKDLLILVGRLYGVDPITFSPDTWAVMLKWKPVYSEMLRAAAICLDPDGELKADQV